VDLSVIIFLKKKHLKLAFIYLYWGIWECGSIVFESVFHSKIYLNNIFLFFKDYFLHQHIKMI
jgi:hypothetical protein